eukprot:6102541-Pleurochrysis_carterae.AAC.1
MHRVICTGHFHERRSERRYRVDLESVQSEPCNLHGSTRLRLEVQSEPCATVAHACHREATAPPAR